MFLRLGSGVVTIKAGTGDSVQDFPVHEDVIKEGSQFFKAAFDRKWREGQSRVLEMPEDEPAVVSGYLEWLYTGRVNARTNPELSTEERNDRDERLGHMYVFAEKVQENSLCDEIIRKSAQVGDTSWDDGIRRIPNDDILQIIYDGTPSGSPARRFFVDLHVARGSAGWIGDSVEDYPAEFLFDFSIAMLRARDAEGLHDPYSHKAVEHIDDWLKKKTPPAVAQDDSSGSDDE